VSEDNDNSRKILVRLLRRRLKSHVKVEAVVDGLRGTETFKRCNPHVVLTDISILEMDCISAAGEMRKVEMAETRPRARTYAITGLGSSEICQRQDAKETPHLTGDLG
jgi:CheY-like chemotaxis protein